MTNQNIVLPAIALRGTTILPGMIVHFDVSKERSVKAIEAAMLHDQKIFLVTQIDPEVESPDLAGVYHVGTIAYIKQVVKLPQNLFRVLVEGTGRATLVKFEQEFPFIRSEITPVDEEEMQMPEPVMEREKNACPMAAYMASPRRYSPSALYIRLWKLGLR